MMKRTITFLAMFVFLLTGISISQNSKDSSATATTAATATVEELVGVYHLIYDGEVIQFCDRLNDGRLNTDKYFSLKLGTVGKVEFYDAEGNIIDAELTQLKQLKYISGQEALAYFRVVNGDSVSLLKIYLKSSDDIFVKDGKFSYENKKILLNSLPSVTAIKAVGETDRAIDEKILTYLNGRLVTGIVYSSTKTALVYFFAPRILKKKINLNIE